MPITLKTPLTDQDINNLKAGDSVYLSGTILTARDAAHKRLCEFLDAGKELPINLNQSCIYYTGPCPAMKNEVIGPCGPTTSSRMDAYTPRFIELGMNAMIGKGPRSKSVIDAMTHHGAIYFAATGGAGMLIANCVKSCTLIAFDDLGAEAIYSLEVENLPLTVAIDACGNNLFDLD